MAWRQRKRAAILASLAKTAKTYRTPDGALRFQTRTNNADTYAFRVACRSDNVDSRALRLTTEALTENPSITARSGRVTVELTASSYPVRLLSVEDAPWQVVDLATATGPCRFGTLVDLSQIIEHHIDMTIHVGGVTTFSFVRQRREPSLFGRTASRSPEASGRRIKRFAPPAPPPGRDKLSLEEGLRWILTPPIQEVLSQLTLEALPYGYQGYGIKWLIDRDSALLADEMGLGKTMQVIIAARLLWRDQKISRILVICPKSLITTWREEIAKWWPAAVPNTRLASSDRRFFLKLGTDNVTIKIINYEALALEADWLKDQRFTHDLIVIDEAQRIKNPGSKTARAVKALRAERRWALTGTPLENKVGDLVSIFGFVRPGLLESEDEDYVRDRKQPFFLRRRTDDPDVDVDLPDKEDHDVSVELAATQREVYDKAEYERVVELNKKGDTVTVQHVFALIQMLMQLCNFEPVHGDSAKLERMKEDLEEIIDSGRKLLVFSQFVSERFGLKRLKAHLPPYCKVVEMHGEVSGPKREAAIRAFDHDPSVNTMLLNYRVGGVGLNLQAANYVYLFDRWWNPAVEDQAVKRAHRIGQHSKVFVRRLYSRDTIEERILRKLAEKRRLFSHVIDDARPTPEAMGITEEEVFSLFKDLKVRPKRLQGRAAPPRLVLDNMDPHAFEELTAKVYEAQGYTVELTGGSHDRGIDILAEKATGPARDRVAVQCKHQRGNVGRPVLQQLWGVASDDARLTRADLVTSADFSVQAREFAAGKRMTLINRRQLVELATKLGVAEFT